jgi:hypothetical protein
MKIQYLHGSHCFRVGSEVHIVRLYPDGRAYANRCLLAPDDFPISFNGSGWNLVGEYAVPNTTKTRALDALKLCQQQQQNRKPRPKPQA